ncbi:MAG: DoxX family protein [Pseudomonadota bacterium]
MIKNLSIFLDKNTRTITGLQSFALLAARLWIAKIFFMSGLTKIKSWPTTVSLFEQEYNVPLLPPELAAYMSTTAELSLPIFLALGFITPLAAIGLMGMTLVIELFVYPGTAEHYYWLLLLGVIATHGSGQFGIDYLIRRKYL